MFEINQKVKVVKDLNGGWFIGCDGIIDAIDKDNLYGLRIYKSNEMYEEAIIDIGNTILYFNAEELELKLIC